jgi:D-alanyl-D-alanine carboxypeptidase
MINANFLKNPDTNWKYVLIVFFTTFLFFGFVLNYIKKSEKELSFVPYFPVNKIEGNNAVYLELFEEQRERLIFNRMDFLEADLSEMKLKIYKEGILEREFLILAKGDPQGWGGSASGLYHIISGNELSFSLSEEVYMPHALHYYGKYYLHGEPYYYGGEKLISAVSGGCLRLSNKDAKAVYELSEINMPLLVMDKMRDGYNYSVDKITSFPAVSAKSYLVADLDSGYVFSEKDSKKQLPIASLTKLMTSIVVAENVNLRKDILIEEEMLSGFGSADNLEPGKSYRIVELFYPLLVESSNNAAEVLSYFLGKTDTIKLMNEKAKSIFMEKTEFFDVSGFDFKNVSTAKDLFYLGRYILNNRQPILDISRGEEVSSFGGLRIDIEKLWNKNIFVKDPSFLGGKTGFLEESKNTALFIFRFTTKEGRERNIAVILLGSFDDKNDTQKIYMWLLENYFGD